MRMNILDGLTWLTVGAGTAWGLGRWCAAAEMGRLRAQWQTRVAYWQDEAERAKADAARARELAAAWAEGAQQGREDVLSLARALAQQIARTDDGPAAG